MISVPREKTWRCVREKKGSEKNIRLVKDMHEDGRTQVRASVSGTEKYSNQK